MDRWVNKGTSGIALLDDSGFKTRLKYVFDVSDTHPGRYRPQEPQLWQMQPAYEAAVLESISNTFEVEREAGASFVEQICAMSQVIAEDNLPDYLDELRSTRDDSFLEDLDDLNLSVRLKTLLSNSVAYTVLIRCGYDADRYFDETDFEFIHDFSTYETVSVLGNASNSISKMVLLEIGRTINQQERISKFAKQQNSVYDRATKEQPRAERKENERYDQRTDLHSDRGLPVALNTDDDIIIVDPEREYGPLVNAMGGEVIVISNTGGGSYINAMDISDEYDEGQDPLKLKSGFIMSLFEQLAEGRIEPGQKSIIDRCAGNIYRQYLKNFRGDPPTLKDLYDDLKRQVEPGAEQLALILELFTTGSLDVFAHQTNINSDNRLLCFDIHELGEELKPVGLLVMLDAIYNRVIRNRRKGKYTHVYIDEIYLFFAASGGGGQNRINQYSSEFLYKCWKRFRKYGAMLTGITQNVEECLESERGKFMFGNSEFMLMFNQAAKDQEQLSEILKISDTQMAYVNNSPVGHGLIKVGSSIVPLINDFPKDTELYRLMSTRPGEG